MLQRKVVGSWLTNAFFYRPDSSTESLAAEGEGVGAGPVPLPTELPRKSWAQGEEKDPPSRQPLSCAYVYCDTSCSPMCRRGAGSRFVPPIRTDPDMDIEGGGSNATNYSSEAEIRSRVLRGPGGGGKESGSSRSVLHLSV